MYTFIHEKQFFKIFKERKKPATAKKPKESKGEKKGKTFAIEHQDHQIMTTFLSELTNHVLKTWNISLFLWINLHLFTFDSLNIYSQSHLQKIAATLLHILRVVCKRFQLLSLTVLQLSSLVQGPFLFKNPTYLPCTLIDLLAVFFLLLNDFQ